MSDDRRDQPPGAPADDDLEVILASLDVADVDPVAPPSSVWDRIATEIADGPDANVAAPIPIDRAAAASQPPSGASQQSRSPRRWLWAAAAAVFVVVAGTAVWFAVRPDEQVVATAQLEYESDFDEAGATAAASASLIEKDGNYLLSLRDSKLPTQFGEPADLELWLIADNDGTLDVQPVAIIDQGDGTYRVPAGLNPKTHDIVDISIEPRDGDATHSGRSILRGKLVST